jgi:DHA1 family bicyclomycin/chloramphenicol resistance-like MFS transporter
MAQAAVLVTRGRIPGWLPLLLGFLQAVGPVSTDMYLPSFPALEAGLHGAAGSAQITLATWILGLSVGQLVVGTVSDRFGRRTPLLIGTAVYTIASAGCASSDSIAVLAVWRFVAALGASASMIVPRAVVRDVAEGHDAARMMSRLILILGAAPILAPSLGGLVLGFASWRAIFWIMTGYGLIGSLLAMALLPDTLPPAARTHLSPAAMFGRYRLVLTDRQFMTHAAMLSCVSFALFAYLGGSPTVFIGHYHLPPGRYAILFGAIAGAYITGSQLNILLVRRFGLSGTLTIVSWAYLALGGLVFAAALTDAGGAVGMALALALMQGVIGFISPTATVGALTHHAAHAGSASAMLGTLQFLIGASSGFLIAWMTNGTALPMAWLMLAGAVGVKIADLCRPRC